MSSKITRLLVAVAFTWGSHALNVGETDAGDERAATYAQYCIPQFDDNPDSLKVYC
jgi:hypothetical protein